VPLALKEILVLLVLKELLALLEQMV
jgi:hypothetical protein